MRGTWINGERRANSGRATYEYALWSNIKARCTNPKHPKYQYYGGRGITMCKEWSMCFSTFLTAIGRRPECHLTLDRKDNNMGYEPGNVRWATRVEQRHNRSDSNKRRTHCWRNHEIAIVGQFTSGACKACSKINRHLRSTK